MVDSPVTDTFTSPSPLLQNHPNHHTTNKHLRRDDFSSRLSFLFSVFVSCYCSSFSSEYPPEVQSSVDLQTLRRHILCPLLDSLPSTWLPLHCPLLLRPLPVNSIVLPGSYLLSSLISSHPLFIRLDRRGVGGVLGLCACVASLWLLRSLLTFSFLFLFSTFLIIAQPGVVCCSTT